MFSVYTCTEIIQSFLPEPHAGLLSGILFGVRTSLDPTLYEALVKTGTLHIVALSGMNITMITTMVMIVLLQIFPRTCAIVGAIGVVIGFIWFVGPSPSVIRAALMAGVSLTGVLFGKQVIGLWSWGVAVVCMLTVKPIWITDLSFQLSVLSSLGLILFGDPVQSVKAFRSEDSSRKQYVTPFIKRELRTTLAAQTFTLPLILFTFRRISLISPFTNILIVWTLPYITVVGFLAAIVGAIFVPAGQVIAWGAWIFLEYVIKIIFWTAQIPLSGIEY